MREMVGELENIEGFLPRQDRQVHGSILKQFEGWHGDRHLDTTGYYLIATETIECRSENGVDSRPRLKGIEIWRRQRTGIARR